ncbi:MAG TPA: DUF721 domain-containing protein, partial [Geobacterales bacterium]|nr:DUF721 domain-containing protein [Geobacterales bacterium]
MRDDNNSKSVRRRMPTPIAVSSLLDTAVSSSLAARLREGRIWEFWPRAVGNQIAHRAQPIAFRNGTLTVAVTGSAWMQQLTFLKGEMKEKLNTLLGEDMV